MELWSKIKYRASRFPDKPALVHMKASGASVASYGSLRRAVPAVLDLLGRVDGKRVGLYVGNNPLWGVYDLALTLGGATVVPIPQFFSPAQIRHVIKDAKVSLLVVESMAQVSLRFGAQTPEAFGALDPGAIIEADPKLIEAPPADVSRGDKRMVAISPDRVIKIIYTSGTTGAPKGVMIRAGAVEAVAESLGEASKASNRDTHLSLLPLSTLLEAVGGLYLPLAKGAAVVYPEGVYGANLSVDPGRLAEALVKTSPTTLILVPALLGAIVRLAEAGVKLPKSLRYVACGGAPVSITLLKRAAAVGMPVFQGYGLSECTSVVAASSRGATRLGSVGKPLGHAVVTIARNGEVMVGGKALMAGYAADESAKAPKKWATGDLGYFDEDGFLYITGRKDDVLTTAHGRNISPEWVEKELVATGAVRQAFVLENGSGRLVALVVPEDGWVEKAASKLGVAKNGRDMARDPAIEKAMADEVKRASRALPDYAAVKKVAITTEPFSTSNGLLTQNGRLRRQEIAKKHAELLDRLCAHG